MRFLKVVLALMLLILSTIIVHADVDLHLFLKGNFVNSWGTEADYVPGENDFPLVSSYQTYGVGLGMICHYRFSFFGLELHYNLQGKTTLTDSSDDDKLEIDTYKYASGILTIGVNLIRNQDFRVYALGGGGVSYAVDAKTKIYTSKYGFEAEISPQEKKYPLTGVFGLGFDMYPVSFMGIFFSGRYQYIAFDEPQKAYITQGGLVFIF